MKKLPTVGKGTPRPPTPSPRSVATLPRAWSLRSLAKIVPPQILFLPHYATGIMIRFLALSGNEYVH